MRRLISRSFLGIQSKSPGNKLNLRSNKTFKHPIGATTSTRCRHSSAASLSGGGAKSFSTASTSSASNECLDVDDIKRLPAQFLRLSGKECYDLSSHQRTDVVVDMEDGRPLQPTSVDWKNQAIQNVSMNEKNDYVVEFKDGTVSEFSFHWVKTQLNRLDLSPESDIAPNLPRIPWSGVTEDEFRSNEHDKHSMTMSFEDIVLNGQDVICTSNIHRNGTAPITNIENAMKILYQSGILLVTSTPVLGDYADASIAALGSALSGATFKQSPDTSPLAQYQHCVKHNLTPKLDLEHGTDGPHRTLYGKVWSTHPSGMTEGTSTADSAYGNDALPLHTGKREPDLVSLACLIY